MENFIIILFTIILIYFILKNEVTFRNHNKIIHAIYDYWCSYIEKYGDFPVNPNHISYDPFECMESYEKTLFRLWDWSCKRIVDKDTYEKIKPYLKHKRR